jgi:hypothetical protein
LHDDDDDDDEADATDEFDELETAYIPTTAALVDGQRRCRNERGNTIILV